MTLVNNAFSLIGRSVRKVINDQFKGDESQAETQMKIDQ